MSKKSRGKGDATTKGEDQNLGRDFNRDLKVDREKFEGIVKNLLNTRHTKREDVKPDERKPDKLIPPQE